MYRYYPLILAQTYLTITVVLFFFGAFEWQGINMPLLGLYLALYQLALFTGYIAGLTRFPTVVTNFNVNAWFKFSLSASLILIIPYIYVYTGKYPWEAWQALGDQGGAFLSYYDQLAEERTPGRIAVMLMRTIFSPALIALLPLFFWTKRLSLSWKIMFFIYIILYFSFSALRGTDKESADFFIFMFCGLFALLTVRKLKGQFKLSMTKKLLLIVLIIFSFLLTYSIFTERKMARLGGDDKVCLVAADVCADMDSGFISSLDEKNKFGISIATMYLSLGYYGMGLALNEEFESTFGLGHSIFISNSVQNIIDTNWLDDRAYTSKVTNSGWDAKVYWVTTYTWLANDVGFFGVALIIFVIGFLFSRAWSGIIYAGDPVALIVFSQLFMMIFYFPAFNVVMQNVDSYFSLVFWLFVWLLGSLPSLKGIFQKKRNLFSLNR